eukprot:5446703-Pyramimonas_sp.AAC.1
MGGVGPLSRATCGPFLGAVVLLSYRRCFARDMDSVNMRATFDAVLFGSFVMHVTVHIPTLPRSRMSSGC